jgi:hypothetical protein
MADEQTDQFQRNLKRLREAEIIISEETFTPEEEKAIGSLSTEEVETLVRVADKLSRDFLRKYSHAILF